MSDLKLTIDQKWWYDISQDEAYKREITVLQSNTSWLHHRRNASINGALGFL